MLKSTITNPTKVLSRVSLVAMAGLAALAMSSSLTSAGPPPPPMPVAANLNVSAVDGAPPTSTDGMSLVPTVISTTRNFQLPNNRLAVADAPSSTYIVDPATDPGNAQPAVSVVHAVEATPDDAQQDLQDGDRGVGFQMLYEASVKSEGRDYVVQVLRPGVHASRQALLVAGTESPQLATGGGIRVFDIVGQATTVVRGNLIISIAGPKDVATRLAVLRSLRLVS
jgi:hypothetical protein